MPRRARRRRKSRGLGRAETGERRDTSPAAMPREEDRQQVDVREVEPSDPPGQRADGRRERRNLHRSQQGVHVEQRCRRAAGSAVGSRGRAGQQDQPGERVEDLVLRIGGDGLSGREVAVPVRKLAVFARSHGGSAWPDSSSASDRACKTVHPTRTSAKRTVATRARKREGAEIRAAVKSRARIIEVRRRSTGQRQKAEARSWEWRRRGHRSCPSQNAESGAPRNALCPLPSAFRLPCYPPALAMPHREKKVIAVLPAYNAEKTLKAPSTTSPRTGWTRSFWSTTARRTARSNWPVSFGLRTVVHVGTRVRRQPEDLLPDGHGRDGGRDHGDGSPRPSVRPNIIPHLVAPLLSASVTPSRLAHARRRPIEGGMRSGRYLRISF